MAKDKNKKDKPVELEQLVQYYNVALSNYAKPQRKMVMLDAMDRGRLWEAINAKFPKYQLLPDSNWVNYVKSNIVSSIYTVTKGASILPTSDDDRDEIENINVSLEHIWDTCDVGYYQLQAGSAAALFNIGVTQVGWDKDATGGSKDLDTSYRGNVVLKNINPLRYMRDPFAESLDTAAYAVTWDAYHKSVIMADARYKEKFKAYLISKELERISADTTGDGAVKNDDRPDASSAEGYYKVYTYFVRYIDEEEATSKIAEIHTLNNMMVLYENFDIKPNRIPFIELYCNLPEGDPIGVSEPAKIMSNNIAYNILSSMMLTAEYKNQRPPKFISTASGLNARTFSQWGNEADKTFIVNGDASRAVHYHQFPIASQQALALQGGLIRDIQTASGVDDRYTGRDTGSVITTGGVEDMLSRVTLIDTPKILNYERYAKELTRMILTNYTEFAPAPRKYFKKDPQTGATDGVEIDFGKLDATVLQYAVNISTELPKNKQRLAATANMIMEKQMQYGMGQSGVELITPEEWLEFQDLPNKEYMLKRMGIQRKADANAEVADTLLSYANMTAAGMQPDDAIGAVAQNMLAKRQGEAEPNPLFDLTQMQGEPDPLMQPPDQMMPQDPMMEQPMLDPNMMGLEEQFMM